MGIDSEKLKIFENFENSRKYFDLFLRKNLQKRWKESFVEEGK